MAELDILRISATAAAQRTQQLFQEMEADESMFRNAVMAAESVIEDLKREETSISQRRVAQAKQRSESIKNLSQDEADWIDRRYQQRMRQLSSRTHRFETVGFSQFKKWCIKRLSLDVESCN